MGLAEILPLFTSYDERFEQAAWYKDREGTMLPVVEALRADPRKNEVRE